MAFLFDPETLHSAAKAAVAAGGDLHTKARVVREQLSERYPNQINMEDK